MLSDFARNMPLDSDVQATLDLLVERIVDILDITGAGVTLISTGRAPRYIAASADAALCFEGVQALLRQGPSMMTFESGTAVAVPDLRAMRDASPSRSKSPVSSGSPCATP